MIIENKKTGKRYSVKKDDWDKYSNDNKKKFNMVESTDNHIVPEQEVINQIGDDSNNLGDE